MKLFFVFLISCIGCSSITSIELKCQFKSVAWDILGWHYQCVVDSQGDVILNRWNRNIDAITGIHEESKSDMDVSNIYIKNSNVYYFPRDLEDIFNNLVGITLSSTKLKEIRAEDLKPFSNLRRLNLHGNELQVIEKDLFQFNPKLEWIFLNNNKLSYIHPSVFNKFVGQLNTLDVSGNTCEFDNPSVWNDTTTTTKFIHQIQIKSCKNKDKLMEFKSAEIDEKFEEFKKIIREELASEFEKRQELNQLSACETAIHCIQKQINFEGNVIV